MTKVIDKGREFSVEVLKNQIGFWNIGAISGGRVLIDGATYNEQYKTTQQVELPVAYGYRVRITLGWDDTYTVSRVIVNIFHIVNRMKVIGVWHLRFNLIHIQATVLRSQKKLISGMEESSSLSWMRRVKDPIRILRRMN